MSDNQVASWHSEATAPRWRLGAVVMFVFGAATIASSFWFSRDQIAAGVVFILLSPLFIIFSRITVSIDQKGLTVRYGGLPWLKNHLTLDSITSAEAIEVKPLEHGGWGYRGSRKLLGRAAVVVRGGQGIRFGLTDGTEFVVTVDNADQGAGVLNDLRAAH